MEGIYGIYDIMERLGMKSPYEQILAEEAGKAAKQIINEKINLDRIIKNMAIMVLLQFQHLDLNEQNWKIIWQQNN